MSKIEISIVKGNSYVCSGRLSVGIILNPANQTVILIDSGLDDAEAKSLDAAIKAKNWTIAAIINTHSHADHCGGNAFFQSKYSAMKIYATIIEEPFVNNPALEPWYLSSGAEPITELQNKLIQAKSSVITDTIPYNDGCIVINNIPLDIITLPGHTMGMIGIINPSDRVLYSGDCIFSEDLVKKHGVLFFSNIRNTKASFNKLMAIQERYDFCVLYHGGIKSDSDVRRLVEMHQKKIQFTERFILEQINLERKKSIAQLMVVVMNNFNIPNDVRQYYLTRTCVMAYLADLQQQGVISVFVDNGDLFAMTTDNKLVTIHAVN